MDRKIITIGNENMTFYSVDHSGKVNFIWKCILCNNSKQNVNFASANRFIWSTSQYLNSELSLEKNPELQTPGSNCNYNDQYDSLSLDCINEIAEKISIKYYIICDTCFKTISGDSINGKKRLEQAKTERLEAEAKRNSENKRYLEIQKAENNIIFNNPSKDNYKLINMYLIIAENKIDEEASKILQDIENYIDSLPTKSLFNREKLIPANFINKINTILVKIQKLNNSELNTQVNNLLKKHIPSNTKSTLSFNRSFKRKSKTNSRSKSRNTSKRKCNRKSRRTSKTSKRKSRKTSKPKSRRTCRCKSK